MTPEKPDLRILTIWRIRLLLAAVLLSFLSAYFFSRINRIWWGFLLVWILLFFYLYLFYYPVKYRKLSYTLNKRNLLIRYGVFYNHFKAIPFTSIQYVTVVTSPLQRAFGICTLHAYSAGNMARIPGLLPQTAAQLQRALTPEAYAGGEPLE